MPTTLASTNSIAFGNHPASWRYVGTYDRTYFVYMVGPTSTTAGAAQLYVNYYDHDSQSLGTPVQFATYTNDDHHGAPALCITDDGYIVVAYSEHVTQLYTKRSTSPETLAFGSAVAMNSVGATYPNFFKQSDGTIYLFYRHYAGTNSLWYVSYQKSTNGGATWGSKVDVVRPNPGAPYWHLGHIGDKMVLAWCTFDYTLNYHRDIRAIESTDGVTWTNSYNGASVTLPAQDTATTAIETGPNAIQQGYSPTNGGVVQFYSYPVLEANRELWRYNGTTWQKWANGPFGVTDHYNADIIYKTELYTYTTTNHVETWRLVDGQWQLVHVALPRQVGDTYTVDWSESPINAHPDLRMVYTKSTGAFSTNYNWLGTLEGLSANELRSSMAAIPDADSVNLSWSGTGPYFLERRVV